MWLYNAGYTFYLSDHIIHLQLLSYKQTICPLSKTQWLLADRLHSLLQWGHLWTIQKILNLINVGYVQLLAYSTPNLKWVARCKQWTHSALQVWTNQHKKTEQKCKWFEDDCFLICTARCRWIRFHKHYAMVKTSPLSLWHNENRLWHKENRISQLFLINIGF